MQNITKLVRPPLRYPGGKFYDLPFLLRLAPDFVEYREPMVGSGSMFFNLRQACPHARFWINDLDENLVRFYLSLQKNANAVYHRVMEIKKSSPNLRELFYRIRDSKPSNDVEHAAFYFVFSRLSFNALAMHNPHTGISEDGAQKNFSTSIISRLLTAGRLLQNVKITNLDFEDVVSAGLKGKTFVFLDPPYYGIRRLYRVGDDFPHERLRDTLRLLASDKIFWMLTYNDAEEVRQMYEGCLMLRWERKHRMSQHLLDKKNYQIVILNYMPPRFQMKLFPDSVYPEVF